MSDTLIKNLQIGDQIYKLSGSYSGVTRGVSDGISMQGIKHQLIRPNSIVSTSSTDADVFMVGIPQEYMQESGTLVMFGDNYGILKDIEPITKDPIIVNKKLTVLADSQIFKDFSIENILYSVGGSYKLNIYWNQDNTEEVVCELTTLDGNIINQRYFNIPMQDVLDGRHNWQNMIIYTYNASLIIALYNTDNEGNVYIYNGLGQIDQWFDVDVTQVKQFEQNGFTYNIMYQGPSYMEVNPVSHYMFNIVMPSDNSLITNIPLTWSQDIAPEFGEDKLVQISVLDGVGTFNSISLQS